MPEDAWKRRLGRTIARHRIKKGLTQEQAAERFGSSLRWWQTIERGRNLSVELLHRIGRVVGAPVWKLVK